MCKKKEILKILNNIYHNMLNNIQVLLGYYSLGKFNKIKDYLTLMVDQIQDVRKLCNINSSSLALYLLSLKQENTMLDIEIKTLEVNNDLLILNFLEKFIPCFKHRLAKIIFEKNNNEDILKFVFFSFLKEEEIKFLEKILHDLNISSKNFISNDKNIVTFIF